MRPSMGCPHSPIISHGSEEKKARNAFTVKHPKRSAEEVISSGWRGLGAGGFRSGSANVGWGAGASAPGHARAVAGGFVLAR